MLAKEQLPVNTFFRRAEKFYESKMIMSRYNTNENGPKGADFKAGDVVEVLTGGTIEL